MDSRLVIANIAKDKLKRVEARLERLGVEQMHVCTVKSFGECDDFFAPSWLTGVRIEIFTRKDEVDGIASAIMDAAHTGVPGDGVIAVLPIEKLYLIRADGEATPQNFWSRAEAARAAAQRD